MNASTTPVHIHSKPQQESESEIVVIGDVVFEPGTIIEQYEIVRRIGKGGMGLVFLARDTRLARLVAIKILRHHGNTSTPRFLVEARMTARCRHENIVVIHEVGEIRHCPYMVLEYVEGKSFRQVIEQESNSMTTSRAIELVLPVLRAITCAHAMGIVHRDLKPENILLENAGMVKVVDFGISKPAATETAIVPPAPELPGVENAISTQTGRLLGTMPYMSPEQWRHEPLDACTDIWALGIILFELLTGAHPLAPLSMRGLSTIKDLELPLPSLHEKRPDTGALGDVVDRCLKKRKEERYQLASEMLETLEAIARDSFAPMLKSGDCPFTGLAAFQETDASLFFGREKDIFAVTNLLRHQEIVVVVGPSGAGKSSFVRAGVVPAFKRSYRHSKVFVVRPGKRPLAALAETILSLGQTTETNENVSSIAEQLKNEPGRLGTFLRAGAKQKKSDEHILVVVDQLEELFTLGIDVDERDAFFSCLEGVADDASSPLRVIAALRADFLDRCTEDKHLSALVARGLFILPQLDREGLGLALQKPLELTGYRFEDEKLHQEMLDELASSRNALPLLQFAAAKLWEARDNERRILSRTAYRAQGGVIGALSAHADTVFLSLPITEQRLARAILLHLVTPEQTRAIVSFDDLRGIDTNSPALENVLRRLVDARLVSIDKGRENVDSSGQSIELTHESLITQWMRLSHWLSEDEQDTRFLAQLRNAAMVWTRAGKVEGLLWRDDVAIAASSWLDRQKRTHANDWNANLDAREQDYLLAVITHVERAQRWKQRVTIAIMAALATVAFVVSILAWRANEQATRADAQATRADAETQIAMAEARAARNETRMAVARELQAKDPTAVLGIVREIEPGAIPRGWESLALWAIRAGVAETILDHKDIVQAVSFSPDGQWIATGAWDKAVRIWNADGMGQPRLLAGHGGRVYAVAFSPDSQRIASCSADATIRIWNVNGQEKPLVLGGHAQVVTMVAWSHDGKRIVSASVDKTVRIWNADGTGQPIVFEGHTDRVNSAAFSPDGTHIVSGAWDNTLRIWNADGSGKPLILQGHTSRVHSVVYSPDGKRIASGAMDKTVRIWNADGTGQPIVLEGHTDRVAAVAFTPDGQHIASVSSDRTVRIWNADGTGQPIVFEGHGQRIDGVAVSPNGKRVASAASDNTVRIWNIDANATPNVLRGHEEVVETAVFSPDGKYIVSASVDKTVRIWNADGSGIPVVLRGHTSDVMYAAFSPDGKRVVSGSADKTVRIWNANGTVEPVILQGHQSTIQAVAFSPDGKRIVSASNDMTIRIWNADGTGTPVILRGHKDVVSSVVFSRDGRRVLSGSWDKTVRIWNADGSGQPIIIQEFGSVNSAIFSPDEQRIIVGCADTTLRIWNADGTGEPIALRGHDAIAGVRGTIPFSPDGKRLVSSSSDGTVRIWNADGTGESILLQASKTSLRAASFSPDGRQIVVASDDHSVLVLRDLEPFQGSRDDRLWTTSRYCLPLDVRKRWLGFSDEQARLDLERCQQMVTRSH